MLEERCGAKLLHRTTRVVRVTDAGASYLAQCKRILAEVAEAEAQASSSQRELSGPLSITAPTMFGRLHVAPIALAFMKQHPRVNLRVTFSDHVIDLYEQNVDVAVRIAALSDSNLHATRVGGVRRVVCASPAYLRARGTPKEPADLLQHDLISFAAEGEPLFWTFHVDGKPQRLRTVPRLVVNSVDTALQAARAGYGLTKLVSYQVASAIAARELRVVLSEYEGPEVPVQVVRTEGKAASARVRAFLEYAVRGLRAALA